jgi:hypothetical protein
MKKRLIIGIVSGILLVELGDAFLPRIIVHYYIDIFIFAAIASLISRQMLAGFVVPIYVILWKVLGLYFLAKGNPGAVDGKAFSWFSLDYAAVILVGMAGGWLGALLYKYKDRQKTKSIES